MHVSGEQPYSLVNPAGANWTYVQHLWSDIPNVKNSSTDSSKSFIGDEIFLRAVKMRFAVSAGYASVGVLATIQWRMSIISTDTETAGVVPVAMPSSWYLPTGTSLPNPYTRFNPASLKVLWSKHFKHSTGNTTSGYWTLTHYHKFNRKFKRRDTTEGVVLPTYWGLNKGKNYYVVLEGYRPDGTNIGTNGNIVTEKTVYFKDA